MGKDLEWVAGYLLVPQAAVVVVRVPQQSPHGGFGLGAHVNDPSKQ